MVFASRLIILLAKKALKLWMSHKIEIHIYILILEKKIITQILDKESMDEEW